MYVLFSGIDPQLGVGGTGVLGSQSLGKRQRVGESLSNFAFFIKHIWSLI